MGLIKSGMPKDEIRILDENALMDLGYVKFSIDMDAFKADINAGKADELKDLVEVSTTYSIVPAKIKVNKKRSGLKALEQTDEILEQVAQEAKMFNNQQAKALSSELIAVEQNGYLLVKGNNIFAKKDTIKALCFCWDGKTKQRYRQRNYLALQFKNSKEFWNSLSWHIR